MTVSRHSDSVSVRSSEGNDSPKCTPGLRHPVTLLSPLRLFSPPLLHPVMTAFQQTRTASPSLPSRPDNDGARQSGRTRTYAFHKLFTLLISRLNMLISIPPLLLFALLALSSSIDRHGTPTPSLRALSFTAPPYCTHFCIPSFGCPVSPSLSTSLPALHVVQLSLSLMCKSIIKRLHLLSQYSGRGHHHPWSKLINSMRGLAGDGR